MMSQTLILLIYYFIRERNKKINKYINNFKNKLTFFYEKNNNY